MRVLLLVLLIATALVAEDMPPALAEPIATFKAATKKTPKEDALLALLDAVDAMRGGVDAHAARLTAEIDAMLPAVQGSNDLTHTLGNVAQSLAQHSAASRPAFRQWLTRKEPAARYIGLQVASEIADPDAMPAFVAEIEKGADPEVAALAAGLVGSLLVHEQLRAQVVDVLVNATRHKVAKVRAAAVSALPVPEVRERPWFAPLRPRLADAAAGALADKDATVRCAAVRAWPETMVGAAPNDAQVKAYLALAGDADLRVVAAVAFHASDLARVATPAQRPAIAAAIAALAKHKDATVREQARLGQEQLPQ